VLGLSDGESFVASAKSADEARDKAQNAIEKMRGGFCFASPYSGCENVT
jgi:hypothetical protein